MLMLLKLFENPSLNPYEKAPRLVFHTTMLKNKTKPKRPQEYQASRTKVILVVQG